MCTVWKHCIPERGCSLLEGPQRFNLYLPVHTKSTTIFVDDLRCAPCSRKSFNFSELRLEMQEKDHGFLVAQSWTKSDANRVLGARSTGLIRIRTPPLLYDTFDWAQLNPDESSELIHLIRKSYVRVRMSLTRAHTHERMWRFYDSLIRISIERPRNAAHLISPQRRRWTSLSNLDEPNRTHHK